MLGVLLQKSFRDNEGHIVARDTNLLETVLDPSERVGNELKTRIIEQAFLHARDEPELRSLAELQSGLRKLTCPPVIISGSSVISLMDRATGRNEIGVSGGADGPPSKQESKNMACIFTEVIGTLALKASDGFSKFQLSAIVVAGYATAFFFLSLTLRTMPVGIAYAIWAGSGTALIVLVGAMLFKQSPDTDALIRIALILAGIVVINLGSSEISAHSG